eukprot:360213-Chlamydomonas_euryale.AAC.7
MLTRRPSRGSSGRASGSEPPPLPPMLLAMSGCSAMHSCGMWMQNVDAKDGRRSVNTGDAYGCACDGMEWETTVVWAGTNVVWAGTIVVWAGTIVVWAGTIVVWAGTIVVWADTLGQKEWVLYPTFVLSVFFWTHPASSPLLGQNCKKIHRMRRRWAG